MRGPLAFPVGLLLVGELSLELREFVGRTGEDVPFDEAGQFRGARPWDELDRSVFVFDLDQFPVRCPLQELEEVLPEFGRCDNHLDISVPQYCTAGTV